jgi:purine-nucleoside phosphorylase
VLGSGLGDLADELLESVVIPFAEIPRHPRSSVPGHRGTLHLGWLEGTPVAVWRGRAHFYEGHSMAEVGFPMRVLQGLGARAVILTNAAGALDPTLRPGQLVVLRDHLNLPGLGGQTPLRGTIAAAGPSPFVSLVAAYDPALRQLALAVGAQLGEPLREGVYAMVAGPSYETPAEARLLRLAGADMVGMSTVPEVLVAVLVGLRVVALSAITNLVALELGGPGADHAEVLAEGARLKPRFTRQIRAMVAAMRGIL